MSVYFIQDAGGEIKIGFSDRDPMVRLSAMQTGNPRELRLLASIPGTRGTEQELHARFDHVRIRGEWFRPDPFLLGFIGGLSFLAGEPPCPSIDGVSFGMDRDHLDRVVGAAVGQTLCDSIEAWCALHGGNCGCFSTKEFAEGETLLERARVLLGAPKDNETAIGANAYAPIFHWESELSGLLDAIRAGGNSP